MFYIPLKSLLALLATQLFFAHSGFSLPIGFGSVPAGLEYQEITDNDFYIYFDKRTPHEAQYVRKALHAANDHLAEWFGKKRSRPLPVILSATTDRASFANFITDALEVQTMGQGHRDLVWHEFVHENMYRHFENYLGPAGSVIHLLWMPSWYVEGLAEALSVSIGSAEQAGVERHYALSNTWPSYDRLHRLYSDPDFNYQGYAVSGAFVAYLMREYQQQLSATLPGFLRNYFYQSMPWYWPQAFLLPTNDSMPFDGALVRRISKNGPSLYAEYISKANQHWKHTAQNQGFSFKTPKVFVKNAHTLQLLSLGARIRHVDADRAPKLTALATDKTKDGWVDEDNKNSSNLPRTSIQTLMAGDTLFYSEEDFSIGGTHRYKISMKTKNATQKQIVLREGYNGRLYKIDDTITWLEINTEHSSLCSLNIQHQATKTHCKPIATHPDSARIVGHEGFQDNAEYLWLARTHQRITGDTTELYRISPVDGLHKYTSFAAGSAVTIASAHTQKENRNTVVLVNGRTHPYAQLYSQEGKCLTQTILQNFVREVRWLDSQHLILRIFSGNEDSLLLVKKADLFANATGCSEVSGHDSPLLYAQRSASSVNLPQALAAASTWNNSAVLTGATQPAPKEKIEVPDAEPRDASWRLRHVATVPWIGSDSDGFQIATLSVPLMDHMQNETVRAYLGYGLYSDFPHSEISLISSRFWPELQLDAFRYQSWNGSYRDEAAEEKLQYGFVDERGARFSQTLYIQRFGLNLQTAIQAGEIQQYRGPARSGPLSLASAKIIQRSEWGAYDLTWNAGATSAPEFANDAFSYNQLEGGVSLSRRYDFLDGDLFTNIEGSQTRGPKRRELQESYRALRVFVPGGGKSPNYLNLPLYGNGALTEAHYGDTQARAQLNVGFPLISNIDKLVKLLYWDKIHATSFINYGGAWRQGKLERDHDLFAAHGHSLTAIFDVKGIYFRLGGGAGQRFGHNLDVFASMSFDAVF